MVLSHSLIGIRCYANLKLELAIHVSMPRAKISQLEDCQKKIRLPESSRSCGDLFLHRTGRTWLHERRRANIGPIVAVNGKRSDYKKSSAP